MIMINHLEAYNVANSGFFNKLTSYDELVYAITEYGKSGARGKREERMGAAYEVFAEFFLKRYGSEGLVGVNDVKDTSSNKFEKGVDFRAKDMNGEPCYVQCKFRSNPFHQFKEEELLTAIVVAYRNKIKMPKNLILFTNTSVVPFHSSYHDSAKEWRVFNRDMQESLIDVDPQFWPDFVTAMNVAKQPPVYVTAPPLRQYQQDAADACMKIINL